MTTDKILEIRDLAIESRPRKGAPVTIVRDINVDVRPGEVVALIGESGSGKTTVALSALGYTRPGLHFAKGHVKLRGQDLVTASNEDRRMLRGTNVAYLAQSAAATFNPALKIGEQITETAVLHGTMTQNEATARANHLFRVLGLPDAERIGERYLHQFSGGQLQRLMAAMSMVSRPSLLVLDEPTTALDVTTQIEVLKAFKDLIRTEKAAALYVTHDLSVVAQIADHIVVMYRGQIMEQGPVSQIIKAPAHSYTKRLMAAVAPGVAGGHTARPTTSAAPVVDVRKVNAGYGRVTDGTPAVPVLSDVSLSVDPGRGIGVIGESGCGKSTLARVIAGLLPSASGDVCLDGDRVQPGLEQRSRRDLQRVQFVFQMADTALNPRQTIGEIIGRPLGFFRNLSGKARRDEVARILELVELPAGFANRLPGELSGGQKQRVNLARALAAEPEVLICDEVTSALDAIVGDNVVSLLKALQEKTGVAIIFISHDLSTVSSFADDIVVLYAGRVVERGSTAQVLAEPKHPYTQLLIASVPEMRIGWLEETIRNQTDASVGGAVQIAQQGCSFFARCKIAEAGLCDRIAPKLQPVEPGRFVECHKVQAPQVAGGYNPAKGQALGVAP
ncbi:ABC transporter ATP-binding protein [Mameliella sediminis]|uniref:ABC transporter ATP-binding protein n=1 Tax=Mameliella sediminis TaxID=2836866 RepID=UPI001C47E644|nr:ABC transporter ATP-binding protein [Mameliella sediminis]MBV7396912.1 ABC transporter ATP-binding protein [Mameliella sediminis]